MISIPRFRGKVGQFESPEEWAGKFCFEITMWTFDGETQIGEPMGPYGPFDTEAIARTNLMDAVRMCCEAWQRENGIDGPAENYIDMKNGGVLRPFENHS